MTFNEYIRGGKYNNAKQVECPVCGKVDMHYLTLMHIEGEHGLGVRECACGNSRYLSTYQDSMAHLASFPDPAAHVREVALLVALRNQGVS